MSADFSQALPEATRAATSESKRLLRQWWNEPGDYAWVVEFLGPRGYLPGLRLIIGTGGLVMGFSLLCLFFEHLQPIAIGRAGVALMTVCAFGWAAYWRSFRWPTARQSAVLFALADIGLALATAVHANPLAALSTTSLFAMTVGIFPFVQFGFWLVRNNAVESRTDPLTDLANRRGLANYLARKSGKLKSSPVPLCAFVIDLDRFKQINDVYGHKIGDTVITRAAERIRVAVGPSAFVARTGGEEFVAVDLLTLHSAAVIAENIRAAIEAQESPKTTASVGAAVGSINDIVDFDAIYACADEAMYAAKRDGGNRIALGGAVGVPRMGGENDKIHFRPTTLGSNGA